MIGFHISSFNSYCSKAERHKTSTGMLHSAGLSRLRQHDRADLKTSRSHFVFIFTLNTKPTLTIMAIMDPQSRPLFFIYLTLRTLQLNACVLTGFTFCYTISQYHYHYCNYDTGCTPQQQAAAVVPMIYIYLLTTVSFLPQTLE